MLLIAGSIVLLVPRAGRAAPEPPRPAGRRTTIAVVAVLGILPLLLVSSARPSTTALAHGVGNTVQVPVLDLGLTAVVQGRSVRLAWPAHGSPYGEVSYRLFRTAAPLVDCTPSTGVGECFVTSPVLTDTTGTSYVDRPGPGRRLYRVAVVGAWNKQPTSGDPFLLSPPLTVTVP